MWNRDHRGHRGVRRSRHRVDRRHRDDRRRRGASRGHRRRLRLVPEHRGVRWRTGRASCPGWDADRPDAEHRSGRLPEAVDRPEDGGHRDADRPEDGDHRSHPDGACPGRWRRGCCRGAACPSATGPNADLLGLPGRPDGACPGRWRRGCCRGAAHWGEVPGSGRYGASRASAHRRRQLLAWVRRLRAWGPWAHRRKRLPGASAWRRPPWPELPHSTWGSELPAWERPWGAWGQPV